MNILALVYKSPLPSLPLFLLLVPLEIPSYFWHHSVSRVSVVRSRLRGIQPSTSPCLSRGTNTQGLDKGWPLHHGPSEVGLRVGAFNTEQGLCVVDSLRRSLRIPLDYRFLWRHGISAAWSGIMKSCCRRETYLM